MKHWRAAVASLLTLAFLAGARADLVLCTGADGHIEIEQAAHGICTGPGSAPETTGLGMASADHCGRCVDVPLGAGPAVRAFGPHHTPEVSAPRLAVSLNADTLSNGIPACLRIFLRPPSRTAGTRVLRI
ncbi:MAG: hypothetical protein RBU21_12985 [FCB group bacterium]|nr:hypothetical protein [FCB group bacterium]